MKETLLILGILCIWIGGFLFGIKNTIEKLAKESPQVIQMEGKSYKVNLMEIKQ